MPSDLVLLVVKVLIVLCAIGGPCAIFLMFALHLGSESDTWATPIDADSRIETAKRAGEAARGRLR